MCTRFVYNGKDTITGFNFDIDLSVWDHKIIKEKDRFYIGIKMPDNRYHSFHGVHRNGNTGTLLYVHGNPREDMLRETPLIPLLILQKIISGVFFPLMRFYISCRSRSSILS